VFALDLSQIGQGLIDFSHSWFFIAFQNLIGRHIYMWLLVSAVGLLILSKIAKLGFYVLTVILIVIAILGIIGVGI
jgi:hypothetical protein